MGRHTPSASGEYCSHRITCAPGIVVGSEDGSAQQSHRRCAGFRMIVCPSPSPPTRVTRVAAVFVIVGSAFDQPGSLRAYVIGHVPMRGGSSPMRASLRWHGGRWRGRRRPAVRVLRPRVGVVRCARICGSPAMRLGECRMRLRSRGLSASSSCRFRICRCGRGLRAF